MQIWLVKLKQAPVPLQHEFFSISNVNVLLLSQPDHRSGRNNILIWNTVFSSFFIQRVF